MAVGQQRGPGLDVPADEGVDMLRFVRGDGLEAASARHRVYVFCPVSLGFLRSAGGPVAHFDGADDDDFSGIRAIRYLSVAVGNLRLVDLDDTFQHLPFRVRHRAPELLREQPRRLVGDGELGRKLERGYAVRVRGHQMRRPEPDRQRQLGPVKHGAGRNGCLPPAGGTLPGPCPAFQFGCLSTAAIGTDKPLGPAPTREERGACRLVGKGLLEGRKGTRLAHRGGSIGTARLARKT